MMKKKEKKREKEKEKEEGSSDYLIFDYLRPLAQLVYLSLKNQYFMGMKLCRRPSPRPDAAVVKGDTVVADVPPGPAKN